MDKKNSSNGQKNSSNEKKLVEMNKNKQFEYTKKNILNGQ